MPFLLLFLGRCCEADVMVRLFIDVCNIGYVFFLTESEVPAIPPLIAIVRLRKLGLWISALLIC
jgi:hypothetical protein